MLAMDTRPPRSVKLPAFSLTTIASVLAPTVAWVTVTPCVTNTKKPLTGSGFEDNFSQGRAEEKCRGKRRDQLSFSTCGWAWTLDA